MYLFDIFWFKNISGPYHIREYTRLFKIEKIWKILDEMIFYNSEKNQNIYYLKRQHLKGKILPYYQLMITIKQFLNIEIYPWRRFAC